MYKLAFSIGGIYYEMIAIGTTSSNITIGDPNGPYYTNFRITLNTSDLSLAITNKTLGSGWSAQNLSVSVLEIR